MAHFMGCGVCGLRTTSVFFGWKLGQQVGPVARDDGAYLGVDLGDVVEALLNLPADYLQFFRAEGQAAQKFDRRVGPNPRLRAVVPRSHGSTSHQAHRRVPVNAPHQIDRRTRPNPLDQQSRTPRSGDPRGAGSTSMTGPTGRLGSLFSRPRTLWAESTT